MMSEPVKGSSLCGKVRYEFQGPIRLFRYCHCSRCRKATGSAHASNIFIERSQFRWTDGEELVARYDLPEARRFATCFCRVCGSPLPHETRDGKAVVVSAGSLDEDPRTRPKENIFMDSRAPWFLETGDLPKHLEYAPADPVEVSRTHQ